MLPSTSLPRYSPIAAGPARRTSPTAQHPVLRVQAEQLERALGLGGGLLAEDEPRADQVLDLADVGQLLRGEDQRRVLRPPEPVQPVDQAAAVARGEQEPRLVEEHDLVYRAVAGHQPH